MKEIREKYGEPVLIYKNENDDIIKVYHPKLLQRWKKAKTSLLEIYRDPESECDAGHFVNRVYVDTDGNYWMTQYWIDHFGYQWDELRIYYIRKKKSKVI
jgi:hypothetical protein